MRVGRVSKLYSHCQSAPYRTLLRNFADEDYDEYEDGFWRYRMDE